MDEAKTMVVEVVESNTVLVKVIQVIKRRRIHIQRIHAEKKKPSSENGEIKIVVTADDEQCRLMKKQFEKIIDVIEATIL